MVGPVQILQIRNNALQMYEKNLDSLLNPRFAKKKVVVVSVAGPFRKGKSFLLNFFLRYLQSDKTEWLGDEDVPLEGFSWRNGTEPETNGILLWSEPFLRKLPGGEEVVVLLMDTQGTFDHNSTFKDNATIFALSTMLSSVQIYNVAKDMQENYLTNLQLFAEYGVLCEKRNRELNNAANPPKPFQDLVMLIRDWQNPDHYGYGFQGGQRYKDKVLEVKETQPLELQQLRKHIHDSFENIKCFLMPHPGKAVATGRAFSGISDISEGFRTHLRELVPGILSEQQLKPKTVNGTQVTCGEFHGVLKAYVRIFKGNSIPAPTNILQAQEEAHKLVEEAREKARKEAEMEARRAEEAAAAAAARRLEETRRLAAAEQARVLEEIRRMEEEKRRQIEAAAKAEALKRRQAAEAVERRRAAAEADQLRSDAEERAARHAENLREQARLRAEQIRRNAEAHAAAIRNRRDDDDRCTLS